MPYLVWQRNKLTRKRPSELAKLHFGGFKPEELFFFEEDSEGEKFAALVILGEKATHDIHCHRCKHAHVSVIFGAETKTHSFRPGRAAPQGD